MKQIIWVWLCFFASGWLFATNGLFLIGNGSRSMAMGGADIAVPSDSTGIVTNPANIVIIHEHSFGAHLGVISPVSKLDSPVAGNEDGRFLALPLASYTYANFPEDFPIAFGIAVYTPIGLAVKYPSFDIVPGIEGSLDTEFGLTKISPTLCWKATDNFYVGASFELGYTTLKTDLFPQQPAIGGNSSDSYAFAYGGKFGLYFQATEELSFGLVYTMKMPLRFRGEFEEGNQEEDLRISGINMPHIFEAGIAYQATKDLLIAFDFAYLNWGEALNTVEFKRDADIPGSVNDNPLLFVLDWVDQLVFAIGFEYAIAEHHKIRLGYNYGNNPILDRNLFPQFAPIVEHHLTVGYGYEGDGFNIDLAYEHGFENTEISEQPNFNGFKVSTATYAFYGAIRFHF